MNNIVVTLVADPGAACPVRGYCDREDSPVASQIRPVTPIEIVKADSSADVVSDENGAATGRICGNRFRVIQCAVVIPPNFGPGSRGELAPWNFATLPPPWELILD